MSLAFERSLRAVKDGVPIERVAAEYTELRQVGEGRYEGRCPLPFHEDHTPSFVLYVGEDPHFYCFGCHEHGDVIDLEEWCGRHMEVWSAMVALSVRYGVELPGRSDRWLEATGRKEEYRDEANRVIGNVLKRRLFRVLVLPYLDAITDPRDRERELERAWEDWERSRAWPRLARRVLSGSEESLLVIARVYAESGEGA